MAKRRYTKKPIEKPIEAELFENVENPEIDGLSARVDIENLENIGKATSRKKTVESSDNKKITQKGGKGKLDVVTSKVVKVRITRKNLDSTKLDSNQIASDKELNLPNNNKLESNKLSSDNHPNTVDTPPEGDLNKNIELIKWNNDTISPTFDMDLNNTKKTLTNTLFSLIEPVFVQIHRGNLLQFISLGIVFPYKYSNQDAFSDIQTQYKEALILSNGVIDPIAESDILIQLDSGSLDPNYLEINGESASYTGVIPISKIIKIVVQFVDVKKKILADANFRNAGFITENTVEVGFPKNLIRKVTNEITSKNVDFTKNIFKFDKVLGLIAGSINFSFLTFNKTENYKSISDHTIFAIQALESNFAKDIVSNDQISEFYKWLFLDVCPDDRILLKWIFERVKKDQNFSDVDTTEFEYICFDTRSFYGEEKQLFLIFKLLKDSIERKKVLSEILELKSKNAFALYLFAYLRIFGAVQNVELSRADLTNLPISKFSEYAFALLNYFFGYKNLRNYEERNLVEKNRLIKHFQSFKRPSIKFEMNSVFDHFVIDNVFKKTFALIETTPSNYVSQKNDLPFIKPNPDNYKFNLKGKDLYGKLYINLEKRETYEDLVEILDKLPNEISIFSEFGICCYRLGLRINSFNPFELIRNNDSLKLVFAYSKKDLIEAVLSGKIEIEEIKFRIFYSKKHNEL